MSERKKKKHLVKKAKQNNQELDIAVKAFVTPALGRLEKKTTGLRVT